MSDFDQYTQAPPAPQGAAASASQDDKTLAMLTHLGGILFWVIVPLIVWLLHKDKPERGFVLDQAREALNFQISITILWFIAYVLVLISFGILFFMPMLVWVLNAIFCVIGGLAAQKGGAYRYPFALRLVK